MNACPKLHLVTNAVARVEELEAIIEQGLKSFIDVGRALSEIRDSELYLETHATFEAYCKARWGMSRPHAYRQIEAAEVASRMSPIGDTPLTESQIRPLTRLPQSQQADAWREAVESAPGGRVTARHVAAVVAARLPAPPVTSVSSPLDKVCESIAKLSPTERQDMLWRMGFIDAKALAAISDTRRRDTQAEREVLGEWDAPGAGDIRFALDGGEVALALLGLGRDADSSSAKVAFRRASTTAHPDKGGDHSTFCILNDAHNILKAGLP